MAWIEPGTMRALLNCFISSTTTGSLRMVCSACAFCSARTCASRRAGVPGGWKRLADVLGLSTNHVELVLDPNYTTNRFYRLTDPRQP